MIQYAGLTETAATLRLATDGPNVLAKGKPRNFLAIAGETIKEPMFALLLAACAVYFVIGELGEAALMAVFASFSVSITIIQEFRSEKVLQALQDLTSPRALVLRDGKQKRIPGREVVREDVIFIHEGDRVPADAYLFAGDSILIDESILTGESMPVRKMPSTQPAEKADKTGGEDLPYIFSGTLVVRGQGRAIVTATGGYSEIGKIGKDLGTIQIQTPRLQKQTRKIVQIFGILAIVVSSFAILLYGIIQGSWLDGALAGIALAMALLPEEFPLVLTVFMVMGAWRISKARVLTRRASTIETLGAATVLCTDKTGTLTENSMSVVALYGHEKTDEEVMQAAVLASKYDTHDPMDLAVLSYAKDRNIFSPELQPVRQYGLRPDLLAVTHVWRDGDNLQVAAKGAPEAIADLCRLDDATKKHMFHQVSLFAQKGIRVLGIAEGSYNGRGDLPENPKSFHFTWLGLIGFIDPLRAAVPQAVADCQSAGIRVIMITGDYPQTARAIANQAGITAGDIITGDEVTALNDRDLQERCKNSTVFARIMPKQKLRIVQALKASGDIVAMTGDGVNDAPALKAADIGIAMGSRGTDVAREASSIVLLDDDFGSIVHTIRLGRRIYDNLQKAMIYITAMHVPIAGLALLPILFGMPLIFTPLLIVLMEMVIDPTCSIVLEAEQEETDIMRRKPRDPRAPILPLRLISWGVFQGMATLSLIMSVVFVSYHKNLPTEEIRSLAGITLLVCNLALVFVNRSYNASLRRALTQYNPFLWTGVTLALGLFSIILLLPNIRSIFQLGPFHMHDMAISLIAGLFLMLALEKVKEWILIDAAWPDGSLNNSSTMLS